MKIIYSFLKSGEKYLLIKTLLLLWAVRIVLWILPFSIIQKIMSKFTLISDESNSSHNISIGRLTWAVNVMSRYTPKATCLTKALTAQILLARYHYSSNIRIGVSKYEGELEAHAWLEANGEIVLGKSEIEYTPILSIGEKA